MSAPTLRTRKSRQGLLSFIVAAILLSTLLKCNNALQGQARHIHADRFAAASKSSTSLNVLAEPPRDFRSFDNSEYPKRKQQQRRRQRPINIKKKRFNNRNRKEDVRASGKWAQAEQVEAHLLHALEAMQNTVKMEAKEPGSSIVYPLAFPAIRDCNAAIAAFGDGEDLLRALRLYTKMKKAASWSKRYPTRNLNTVPAPTLVTYSTLMSRAVHLGKPHIALRLWNLMRGRTDFFASGASVPPMRRIVPDVKAANILMNCYAKLGNLEAAEDLMEQMLQGGDDVPPMTPNLVTYNTLLDACHKSNELDAALRVKEHIEIAGIRPDARTYTTLIATVARKASVASGANDPTMAFSFLKEMKELHIRPNGMTYSALIDACGRCRRSDLALKALRLMLDQKTQEQKALGTNASRDSGDRYTLSSEVGAWTAAINACGKAGRIDTAVKLFYSMPNFGVYPNTVTCGCLVDCLLKNGRVSESLTLLRYMKKNRIAPSEVMYTSLMTSAGRLAELENERLGGQSQRVRSDSKVADASEAKAVDIYTELIGSLMHSKGRRTFNGMDPPVLLANKGQDDSNEVYKVSLIFQEMRAAGVEPDLACYNALLRSCANAGDVRRAEDVLNQIKENEDLEPSDKTWREMIRAAGKAGRIDIAISTWKEAVAQIVDDDETGKIDVESVDVLLSALVENARNDVVDSHTVQRLHQLVFKIYEAILSSSDFLGMNLVDRSKALSNPKLMLTVLRAIVSLEKILRDSPPGSSANIVSTDVLRNRATDIIHLDCLRNGIPNTLRRNSSYVTAYKITRSWLCAQLKSAIQSKHVHN